MTALALTGIGDEAGRSLELQLAAHETLGWRALELRTIDRRPLDALTPAQVACLAAQLDATGIEVPVIASGIANWSRPVTAPFERDVAELESLLDVARALGAPFIRVMSYPNSRLPERDWRSRVIERMSDLAVRAEASGVVLIVENCAGYAAHDPERALDIVTTVDSSSLRLLFDTGNPAAYGYDGLDYLDQVAPYVEHVHIKDAVLPAGSAQPTFVPPGDGSARVADCLRCAIAAGYRGALSLEPEVARVVHLDVDARDAVLQSSYLACGRRLERLITEELPNATVVDGRIEFEVAVA